MLTPKCSKCGKVIPSSDVNVVKDVAYCRGCNLSYDLSALTHGEELDTNVDFANPPAGAWYRNDAMDTVIGATHRSLGMAFGALAISLFWNGIVSVFVLLAIAGTMSNLHLPLPDWFPAPKMNGGPMSVGMTIFLWIFLTPFIVIGLTMIGSFISSLGGRTEVRIRNMEGAIFRGIGGLGWSWRFDTSDVKAVRIDERPWSDSTGNSRNKTCIVIETHAGRLIKFGSMLTDERRRFVASAARKALRR